MTQLSDLITTCSPNFCPGCGDFAIWAAFKNAAVAKGWNSSNSLLVAGIGCHGHILNFTKINSFEGLHGRAIPVATGAKMANNNLNVFVFTGDGDSLAEGTSHFVHACRRNHNITVILHDNAVYGLTTGQTSPRSPKGFKTKSTPAGSLEDPINPVTLAIASGATFVAREYAANIPQLTELIIKANDHKGISIVDILQPCVSFNPEYTHGFYQKNTYRLEEGYDKTNKELAFKKSLEWARLPSPASPHAKQSEAAREDEANGGQGEKQIPLGIFYEVEKPSYEAQIPQIAQKPLISTPPVKKDLSEIFKKYS
jgi:2-oxoglutarate/2-oxoacid ferredoxin oxidoreductase subunit beta